MVSIVLFAVLVFAAAVALIRSARFGRRLPLVGATALTLGMLVLAFFVFGPKDYLVRWPSLSTWLHPFQLIWYAGVLCLVGGGILLGSAARRVFGS